MPAQAGVSRVRFAIAAAVVGLVVLVRLPFLLADSWSAVAESAALVQRGLTEAAPARIQRVTAVTPEFVAAVREHLPADGRLVLYSPYVGNELEFLLRLQFERTKNLLYPRPRDVHFAAGAEELQRKVRSDGPSFDGRLLVLDGTQGGAELAIGGRYELVHSETFGGAALLRLWRLVEAN